MLRMNPLYAIDFYKADHRRQLPKGTKSIYSNFCARKSRIEGIDRVVFFGLQYIITEYLMNRFNRNFFNAEKHRVVVEYQDLMTRSLGCTEPFDVSHIEQLHDLGYLPIRIKALPEGSLVPLQVPLLTIENTHPDFAWLTNYLETLISCELWKACTSATIANEYRRVFKHYAQLTGSSSSFVDWQGHDFSMRGMSGVADAAVSGAGHLLSFKGTDSVPSLLFIEEYYGSENYIEAGSVPATEHSVMCADLEIDTLRRLLTEVYPTGVLSVVADSYNLWDFITKFMVELKPEIMRRDGKLVIRPDSGDPVKIICGDEAAKTDSNEYAGVVHLLQNIFGGYRNAKGFWHLDPHVGVIYGDSITLERQQQILKRLHDYKHASDCVVLGIGSYTYQYQTRDTFGFVCKATHCEVDIGDGFIESRSIFKNPITGGWKKSHRGLLHVTSDYGVNEEVSREVEQTGLLQTVFKDGVMLGYHSFEQIQERLRNERSKLTSCT